MAYTLHRGDCLDVMRGMAANSVDTILSDPPYGLKFMEKGWDHGVPGVAYWEAALRVAKPGAMLLAFGGTRTYHRLACAIEDARWAHRVSGNLRRLQGLRSFRLADGLCRGEQKHSRYRDFSSRIRHVGL